MPDPRERSIAWSGDRFVNLTPTNLAFQDHFLRSAWRFLTERRDREPQVPMPVVAPRWDTPATGLRVTWLGHSTVMIEVGGRRVLTDPMWSERASPVSGIGPRRFHPPPVPLADVPGPDVVLLSHDHYDHLDLPTIRALATRSCRFVAPLGVGALLRDAGVSADRITELDWWEAATVADDLRMVATPARHFSGRSAGRRNPTLWASFALLGREHRVFFGGDGGLDDVLTQIGARFGPFDLAMLEIGASDPAWIDIHLGPVNAVEACRRLGARLLLPIHWASFNLGLHPWYDPPQRLCRAAAEGGLPLALPRIGETFDPVSPPTHPWWQEVQGFRGVG